MDDIKLTSITPSAIIHEEASLKAIRIIKLTCSYITPFTSLRLNILDEKDIPIYSKLIDASKELKAGDELEVNKEFAIWEHLTINIFSEKENIHFEILIVLE